MLVNTSSNESVPQQQQQPHPRAILPKPEGKSSRYVSFGTVGHCTLSLLLPPGSRMTEERRTMYSNLVVPQKRLRVLGRYMLRSPELIPRVRDGQLTRTWLQNATSGSVDMPTGMCRPQPANDHIPSNITTNGAWKCSHKMLHSSARTHRKDCPSSSDRTTSSIPPSDQPHFILESTGELHRTTGPINTMHVTSNNVAKQLRPSSALLVRLGRQLVRSQYAEMTVNECGCGDRQSLRMSHLPSKTGSATTTTTGTSNRLNIGFLSEHEASHLDWRPKSPHPRWVRVRETCRTHSCPYIPATIFLLHRHLELGHQQIRCCFRTRRVPAINNNSKLSEGITTTPERPDFSQDKLRESRGEIERCFSRIYAPLVLNMCSNAVEHVVCPVCPDMHSTSASVLAHIRHMHPFIWASPLEKPSKRVCSVCGHDGIITSVGGQSRVTLCGSVLHNSCQPRTQAYRSAEWAAHDVHPLACLMLYPNSLSRLALLKHVAIQLYNVMDATLTSTVAHGLMWFSYANLLHDCLAISCLYGQLITVDPVPIQDECSTESLSAPVADGLMDITVPRNNSICADSKTKKPFSTPISTTSMFGTSSLKSICDTNPIPNSMNMPPDLSSGVHSRLKRARLLEDGIINSPPEKRPSVVTFPSSISGQILNGTTGANTDGNETIAAAARKHITTSPCTSNSMLLTSSRPPPSNLTNGRSHSATNPFPWRSGSGVLEIKERPCELCGSPIAIRNHRQHIISKHLRVLPSTPAHHCKVCGQLFWTSDGCSLHRSILCALCSQAPVCRSTLYTHMAIKHSNDLLLHLRIKPIKCLLCDIFVEDPTTHLSTKHLSTIPFEVLKQLELDRRVHRGFPIVRLQDLTPLYNSALCSLPDYISPKNSPEEVVLKDTQFPGRGIFRCSVCHLCFISAKQLDLHMVQSGHRYLCAFCPFACERFHTLVVHQTDACYNRKQHASSSFKFIRLDTQLNEEANSVIAEQRTPAASTNFESVPSNVPTSSDFGTVGTARKAVGSLSQFHGCDLCPVFCLTLADLDNHRRTAHQCVPLDLNRAKNPRPTILNTTHGAPSMVPNIALSSVTTVGQRRVSIPGSSNQLIPGVIRPTAPTIFSTTPQQPLTNHGTSTIVLSNSPVKSAANPTEELMCPMCEFQSTERSVIMKHITDTH